MTIQDIYYNFINNSKVNEQWGQTFFRDVFIPELLGSDTHSILYWAGKRMARELPLANVNDLVHFFEQTKLGNLTQTSNDSDLILFKLSGPMIEERLKSVGKDADFMFEAGFLAQEIEHQQGIVTEAEMDPKKTKNGLVTIQVHLDPNQPATELINQPDLKFNQPESEKK